MKGRDCEKSFGEFWREDAATASVTTRTKEDGRQAISVKSKNTFTREQLLASIAGEDSSFTLSRVLDTAHARTRAPQFWNQAMALLQEKEVIGRWKELEPLPAGTRNWKKAFREQQLEILPSAAGRQVIKEIATAKKVAAKRTRRKAKPAP